ncbi:hypothetical protein [Maridesulfovibrio sp.]|uniref:hypothetical protein n=1 Tax=Maridesulfovibrio sp. TaxID=2795000 RepID=UPI002A1899FA|nr:hypothetical protein [Maridesulfovibrio sp.]
MKADNVEIKGSETEPLDLSFSASYRIASNLTLTPELTYGLNDDAGAPLLSLRAAWKF